MKKKIMLLFMIVLFLVPCVNVNAKTLGQMRSELKKLQSQKAEADSKKNLTDSQISALTDEINTITSNISQTKNDIKTTEDDIIKNQNEIEAKKEETNELLKFLQVSSGENVYLEYIFEAESYTDFIYRYSVVSQLTEHNEELMDELAVLVDNLETKKKELAGKQSKLESESSDLNSKMAVLKVNLQNYKEEGTTLEEDINDMKKKIKEYDDLGCRDNEDVTSCIARINSSKGSGGGTTVINATGWSYPLTWGCVTSEYVGYGNRTDWSGSVSGHHGIDLDCVSEGTKVYAAATGVVARIVKYSSCGGNMVWVYHNVNGVPYTTVYMHLLSISAYENQIVTPSTVIGAVGGGSTASYDNCTGGSHLHFGMAYGHNAYNFNANSLNPRNIINFPALYYNGGGYFSR